MSLPICPACQRENSPYSELNPDHGMIQKCGKCHAMLLKAAPAPEIATVEDRVRSPFETMRLMTPPQPLATTTPVPAADPPRATIGLRADDLMDFARARLAVVEAQLAEKGALELEAAKLRRILAADDPSPEKVMN